MWPFKTFVPWLACLLAVQPNAVAKEPKTSVYLIRFAEAGALDSDAPPLGKDSSSDAAAYAQWLAQVGEKHRDEMSAWLGRVLKPRHVYTVLLHGMALDLTAEEASKLRSLPFITGAYQLPPLELYMHSTPQFVGADWIWDGLSTTSRVGT